MSTKNSTGFQLDYKSAQNIIAKRKIFRHSDVGEKIKFEIQGDGNTIPVTDKTGAQVMDQQGLPLMKTIYNTKVNSHVALLNPRNKQILDEAIQAETAGNVELAHTKFNEFLNKTQVSFSVILNNGRKNPVFHNGDMVKGRVVLITTDNGQLITVEDVTMVHIEEASAMPKFNLIDLLGLDSAAPKAEDVFTPLEGATGAAITDTAGAEA